MSKTRIEITHQIEKTKHRFLVVDPNNLSRVEIVKIINKMNVEMIFVNGKLYRK